MASQNDSLALGTNCPGTGGGGAGYLAVNDSGGNGSEDPGGGGEDDGIDGPVVSRGGIVCWTGAYVSVMVGGPAGRTGMTGCSMGGEG